MQSSFAKTKRITGLALVLSAGLVGAACTSSDSQPVGGGSGGSSSGSGSGGSSSSSGSGGSSSSSGSGGSSSSSGSGGSASSGSGGSSGGGKGGSGGTTSASGGTSGSGSGGSGGKPDASTGGSDTASAASVCDGKGTRKQTATKIDDFEATLSPAWSPFNDITPPHSAKPMLATGGAAGTGKSLRYMGKGAKTPAMGGFGVGLLNNVAIDKAAGNYCIDISAFDGISFWAKATKDKEIISVNFVLPETSAKADGGDCLAACYIHPNKNIELTTEWKQYTINFVDAMGGSAEVRDRIQQIGFLSPGTDWDYYLDELAFFKGTAPPGKVGM